VLSKIKVNHDKQTFQMKNLRKSILCLLCWCLCATLAAQTVNDIDSLEQVLASVRHTQSEKVDALLKLSHVHLFVDSAKCRAYATEALQLSQKFGLKLEEARVNVALGNFYSFVILPRRAHSHYIKAEKVFIELKDMERLHKTYTNMMNLFYFIRDYDNTAYYANKVLSMDTEWSSWKLTLSAQFYIGDARFRNNYTTEALDYFLDLYHKAFFIEDSLSTDREVSSAIGMRCADIYFYMKRPHEILLLEHRARINCLNEGATFKLGLIYNNLAQAHAMLHNIDSAEYYIKKTLDAHMITNQMYGVYFAAAKVDSLKGDYLSALANFQKFHHISDSLSKDEKTTEMARVKLWYEFDQKELENTLMQQEYQKQRKLIMVLVISLVMILILLAIAVFFYRKITEKNHEITEKNHEMKELHAVKDKLFSVVAHDLRSPMGALISTLKLAGENRLDTETQALLLKDVSDKVDDTYGLLDNLLHWAKSQMQGIVPAPAYFDVQKESHAIMDTLQNVAAAKGITLYNLIESHQVYADRDMFAVVLRNLITNAIKFTSAKGELTLSSELSGDMLTVSVKDTGTGIPQEIQDKLFKLSETKSQRGTGNESGTGLGLVLCDDFVKANGGSIWFTSVQDEGSTFFFNLPTNGKAPDEVKYKLITNKNSKDEAIS